MAGAGGELLVRHEIDIPDEGTVYLDVPAEIIRELFSFDNIRENAAVLAAYKRHRNELKERFSPDFKGKLSRLSDGESIRVSREDIVW